MAKRTEPDAEKKEDSPENLTAEELGEKIKETRKKINDTIEYFAYIRRNERGLLNNSELTKKAEQLNSEIETEQRREQQLLEAFEKLTGEPYGLDKRTDEERERDDIDYEDGTIKM